MLISLKRVASVTALAALSGFAGVAQSATVGGVAVDAIFFVSGASAAREVPPAIAASNCDIPGGNVGDPVKYNLSTDGPNFANYKGIVCKLLSAAPIPAALQGKRVAIFTRAAGGSLFGIKPIAVRQQIQFIDPSTCPAPDATPATEQSCTALAGTGDYNGTAIFPDIGISDEDGAFVCAVALGNQCTAAEKAGIKNTAKYKEFGSFQTIWTIQGGSSLGNFGGGGAITNVSSEVVTGVFSGTIQSVQQIQKIMGLPVSAGTTGLRVCSRTNTSGTKAYAIYAYTGAPYCGSTTALGFVSAAAADANGYTVIDNGSSGGVDTCMNASPTTAIGINSLENQGNSTAIALNINGVTPSQVNAAKGIYPWISESTVQYNADQIALTDGNATAAQRTAFATLFVSEVENPARYVGTGLTGELGLPTIATPSDPYDPASPTGWTSKFVGFGGNNCRLPQPVFPTYP
jgi:hypothetical protein